MKQKLTDSKSETDRLRKEISHLSEKYETSKDIQRDLEVEIEKIKLSISRKETVKHV